MRPAISPPSSKKGANFEKRLPKIRSTTSAVSAGAGNLGLRSFPEFDGFGHAEKHGAAQAEYLRLAAQAYSPSDAMSQARMCLDGRQKVQRQGRSNSHVETGVYQRRICWPGRGGPPDFSPPSATSPRSPLRRGRSRHARRWSRLRHAGSELRATPADGPASIPGGWDRAAAAGYAAAKARPAPGRATASARALPNG